MRDLIFFYLVRCFPLSVFLTCIFDSLALHPDFIYHLNVTSSPCENTESNDTCVYQCDEGFSPSGVATCYLGEWIEGPTCDENPCPGNPVVEHMDENRTTCVGTPSGETCQLLCEDGYTPTVYV